MVANPDRRERIADAALELLGERGARALTFRAVDTRAGVPTGTTSNYFASRGLLLRGLAERIFERLTPSPDRVAGIGARAEDPSAAAVAYVEDVARRLLEAPMLALALVELRLEAGRTPAIAEVVRPFLDAGQGDDAAFHERAGLPGGPDAVRLLHHAIDGLVLDALTGGRARDDVLADARELARRIVGGGRP